MKIASTAVLLLSLNAAPFAFGQSFDKPVQKKVVDLGPSLRYSDVRKAPRVKLSCWYYPTLMVKQYDEGEKGSGWLSFAPVAIEEVPPCSLEHGKGEKLIEGREWSGYFEGAKQNLVFFRDFDGAEGSIVFVVYDSRTGNKVFQDSALLVRDKNVSSRLFDMRFGNSGDGQLVLRYSRVVVNVCSISSENPKCWSRIRRELGLANNPMPQCDGPGIESAVAYSVEVKLAPQESITPISGPLKCWSIEPHITF